MSVIGIVSGLVESSRTIKGLHVCQYSIVI